jgi:Rho-binding antiterminator
MNSPDDKPYVPIDCDFHDELEAAATLDKVVELVLIDDSGQQIMLREAIVDLGHLPGVDGEFMTLKSGKRFRFDRIVSIDGKLRPRTLG